MTTPQTLRDLAAKATPALRELRELHVPAELVKARRDPKPVWCGHCWSFDSPWPCTVVRLLDQIEALTRRAEAVEADWQAAAWALRDVAEWLEAEADYPRPDPRPAMRRQAQQARAVLSQPHSAEPTGTLRERLRATAIRDARLHPWDPQPVATPDEERKLDSLAQPHSAEGGRNE